jgi:hypothetical protein
LDSAFCTRVSSSTTKTLGLSSILSLPQLSPI